MRIEQRRLRPLSARAVAGGGRDPPRGRGGGAAEGSSVMATGSVSATKFGAATFRGCEAPAGDGRGRGGRRGVVAAACRDEEAAGSRLLTATGTPDIVYCAPSPTGPAEPPPSRAAGLKLPGCAGHLWAPPNHESKQNRGGVPPLFSPGSGCPPRSVRARAVCLLREQRPCGMGSVWAVRGRG